MSDTVRLVSRVHAYGVAGEGEDREGPLAPDLTRATAFAFPDGETLRRVLIGELPGEVYPRYGHACARAFESRVAELEGAAGAVSFSSGLAALHAIVCGLVREGEAVAVSGSVYGGLEAMLEEDLPRFGIQVRRFDPFQLGALSEILDTSVRVVHIETPTNPLCRVVDVSAVAEAAHSAGALLSVDATFMPPPFQRSLSLGADLAMHSATKFLGGHSDVLGGVVSGRHENLERLEGFRRRTGGVLGPDAAWLLTRSLATLEPRVRQASTTAEALGSWLEDCRESGGPVRAVHYPGLVTSPDRTIAERQMESGGAMLSFEVEGGESGALEIYDRLRVIRRAVSLGGVESVASLPMHTSHLHTPPEVRREAGITDGLIRLSIGLEPADRLRADLEQALRS